MDQDNKEGMDLDYEGEFEPNDEKALSTDEPAADDIRPPVFDELDVMEGVVASPATSALEEIAFDFENLSFSEGWTEENKRSRPKKKVVKKKPPKMLTPMKRKESGSDSSHLVRIRKSSPEQERGAKIPRLETVAELLHRNGVSQMDLMIWIASRMDMLLLLNYAVSSVILALFALYGHLIDSLWVLD